MASQFKVVALIAARNENDIIGQVIEDLIRQGVDVYFIDDGSTDGTPETVARWQGKGVIDIETRGQSAVFDWAGILRRKEQLARQLDADWFMHHDADEFRQSPFPGKSLRQAIHEVDELGYNAIDFRVLNFRPTSNDSVVVGADVRTAMRYFEPAEYWEALQVKAWKKAASVDLASSGGHEAKFEGRLVFPVQFLQRHYPVRSQAHGERKVFVDRQPRFSPTERQAGWHIQYSGLSQGQTFLRSPSSLIEYDEGSVLRSLRVTHRDTPSLAVLERRLEALSSEAKHRSVMLAAATTKLDQITSQLADAQTQIETYRQLTDTLTLQLATERQAAESIAANFERQIDILRVHANAVQQLFTDAQSTAADASERYFIGIRSLQQELEAVYHSRSWRVMAPARWALGLIVGRSVSSRPTTIPESEHPFDWGGLARTAPLSDQWGLDRGQPIDRYFIESFLRRHAADIHGTVFEIKDDGYSRMYGQDRVTDSVVVDIDVHNAKATLHADLTKPEQFPVATADCFILTQTLHIIYDYTAALRTALKVLKPGGILLCTIPAVSRVNYEDGGLDNGDFWRMTRAAVARLVAETTNGETYAIETFGNVRTCTAFLYGLAVEEVPRPVLDFHDPWFPLVHCLRVVKKAR